MLELTALDFVIVTIVLVSTAIALVRGFTREVLSIVGWIVAVYGALFIGPLIAPITGAIIGRDADDFVTANGSLLVTFLAIIVAFSIGASIFASKLQASAIGALDRTLGVVFGAFRGLLIVFLGYFVVLLILPEEDHPDWIAKARLRPVVQTGTAAVVAVLPLDRLPVDVARFDSLLKEGQRKARQTARGVAKDALRNEMSQQLDSGPLTDMIDKNFNAVSDAVGEAVGDGLAGQVGATWESQKDGFGADDADNTDSIGYKANERALMERLIENTEGVE